jgi:hypothetical protein
MDIDHLVRLKLAGKGQDSGNRTSLYHRYARGRSFWSRLNSPAFTGTKSKPRGNSEDCARSNQDKQTLSHCVFAPLARSEMEPPHRSSARGG